MCVCSAKCAHGVILPVPNESGSLALGKAGMVPPSTPPLQHFLLHHHTHGKKASTDKTFTLDQHPLGQGFPNCSRETSLIMLNMYAEKEKSCCFFPESPVYLKEITWGFPRAVVQEGRRQKKRPRWRLQGRCPPPLRQLLEHALPLGLRGVVDDSSTDHWPMILSHMDLCFPSMRSQRHSHPAFSFSECSMDDVGRRLISQGF